MVNGQSSCEVLDRTADETSSLCLIEKEVDMGYFENYSFDKNSSAPTSHSGCSRISKCHCNCNDCIIAAG